MKAITIHQPWASAILYGMKRFETRSRRTNHTGPIAIHAGKTVNEDALISTGTLPWFEHMTRPLSKRWSPLGSEDFPTGSIIATADLSECFEMTEEFIAQQSEQELSLGGWEVGRFAYQLDNVVPVGPFEARGKQGLWNWDEGDLK